MLTRTYAAALAAATMLVSCASQATVPKTTRCSRVWYVYTGQPGGKCQSKCLGNGPYDCWSANASDGTSSGCMQCTGDNSVPDWSLQHSCDYNTEYVGFLNVNCSTCPLCSNLTKCLANSSAPYEASPPSFTVDRVCTAERFRTCDAGQYARPATATNVSACSALTDCVNNGTWSPTAPTPTSDVVCNHRIVNCTVWVNWESVAATITSDRVCGNNVTNCLAVNNTWSSSAPTQTSNVVCNMTFAMCDSEYPYKSAPATFTSDPFCVAQCSPNDITSAYTGVGGQALGVCVPKPTPRSAPSLAVVGTAAGLGGLVVGSIVAVLVSRRVFAFKNPSRGGICESHYEQDSLALIDSLALTRTVDRTALGNTQ
jgi:hypothetical protein